MSLPGRQQYAQTAAIVNACAATRIRIHWLSERDSRRLSLITAMVNAPTVASVPGEERERFKNALGEKRRGRTNGDDGAPL